MTTSEELWELVRYLGRGQGGATKYLDLQIRGVQFSVFAFDAPAAGKEPGEITGFAVENENVRWNEADAFTQALIEAMPELRAANIKKEAEAAEIRRWHDLARDAKLEAARRKLTGAVA